MDPYSSWRTPDIEWEDFDPFPSADGGLLLTVFACFLIFITPILNEPKTLRVGHSQ